MKTYTNNLKLQLQIIRIDGISQNRLSLQDTSQQ